MAISLLDALKDKRTNVSFLQSRINYHPVEDTIVFHKKDTGVSDVQIAKTETDLKWFPFLLSLNRIVLISFKETKFDLELCGEYGYKNGEKALSDYGEFLYSNKKIHAVGDAMTMEIFSEIANTTPILERTYWLKNSYSYYGDHGIRFINGYEIDGKILFREGNIKNNGNRESGYRRAIRPIVWLPPSTMIERTSYNQYDIIVK